MLVDAKKPLFVIGSPRLQRFFGFILTQVVRIKLMAASHPIGENFASDFPKNSEAGADDNG
jgi:hypothetical protein